MPAPAPPPAAAHAEWCARHCYQCGRTFEHVAEFGPTRDCLCDSHNPADPPLSDLEFEALPPSAFDHDAALDAVLTNPRAELTILL